MKHCMGFRWIAALSLWALLAGPMFHSPLAHKHSQARTIPQAKTTAQR